MSLVNKALSRVRLEVLARKLQVKVNEAVEKSMKENSWAQCFAAIISPIEVGGISQDPEVIPYMTIPTPEIADFLESQYQGALITWWTRPPGTVSVETPTAAENQNPPL